MVEDAGASAVAVHGRTAAQSYSGESDWSLIGRVAEGVNIPVIGSGDCVEASDVLSRLEVSGVAGVLVGRGALRNPWIFRQAADERYGRPGGMPSPEDRRHFLLDYIDLLLTERVGEQPGFRHVAPGQASASSTASGASGQHQPARGRERWVINKVRALAAWYTKGLVGGSQLRVQINSTESIAQLRELIDRFFASQAEILV
jgi:tRNA-dihydrouridine synthase